MRRSILGSTLAIVMLTAAIGLAQAPAKIATMDDHIALMKSNAGANGMLNKSLAGGAFADAKTAAATLRTNYTTLRTFWTEKKNNDALKIVNDGLTHLDGIDKLLAAATPDQAAAQGAAKAFGGATCASCHKMMREGDPKTGFKFVDSMNPFKM